MLARQAQEIINRCDKAERQLRRIHLTADESIRIACSLELSYSSHIRLFVQQFMARYPNSEVTFEVIPGALPEAIVEQYDLVFSPCNYISLPEFVQKTFIMSHGTYAFLPPGHPMVSRSMIPLSQLSGEFLIVPYPDELFGPYARNAQLAERSAREKLHIISAANVSSALFMVSIGQGILIGPRYLRNMALPDTFAVNILDQGCKFEEYLYCYSQNHPLAETFEREFKEEYLMKQNAAH